MPIDPNIILGIKPPQIQQQDPMDQFGKALTLRNLVQQGDLHGLQYEKAQRDADAEKRINALFAGNQNATPEDVMAIDPTRGFAFKKLVGEADLQRATINEKKIETTAKAVAVHRDQLANVNDPQSATQWVTAGYQDPIVAPILSRGGSLQDAISRIPQDPKAFESWKQQNALGATKWIEANAPKVGSRVLGATSEIYSTPGLGGQPTVLSSTPMTETPAERRARGLAEAKYTYETGQPPPQGSGPVSAPLAAPSAPQAVPVATGAQPVQVQPASGRPLPQKIIDENRGKFEGARQTNVVEYEKALNERVAQGADLNLRLQESNQALQDFKTGGGKEARVKLAQLAQATPGISPALVNAIAGGDLSAAQEFEKLQISSAMEQLRLAMGGTGRITQSEFAAFRQANPNLNLDPNAIKKISDFTTKQYRVSREEQKAFSTWLSDGKSPTAFREHWDQELERRGITQPNLAAAPKGAAGGESFASMPDPSKYSGRKIRADDGTIYVSDGKKWNRGS